MLGAMIRELIFDYLVRPFPIRGKFKFLSRFLPKTGVVSARVNGLRGFALDLGDLIQRNVYLGSYEMPETRWARSVLQLGDSAIDVGANCGYYTSLFLRRVGRRGRVLAVEANPRLSQRLSDCLQRNGVDNVDLICAGSQRRGRKSHVVCSATRKCK